MKKLLVLCAALALCACATVSTQIVELNPAQKYPPTQSVEVLLQKPTRPHVEIALIESHGGSEAEMLNDAREKARALGADAIVRTEAERQYHPPVAVYDPWFDPFWYGPYHYRPFPPYPYPGGAYRVVGGGYSYLLKVVAIRYTDKPSS
ncbi:MAG TPA: hypothetical protein VED01_19455 [Burkholderiales bacterium]|nr:hypothetical protein [Burkholderiales bacterium]